MDHSKFNPITICQIADKTVQKIKELLTSYKEAEKREERKKQEEEKEKRKNREAENEQYEESEFEMEDETQFSMD